MNNDTQAQKQIIFKKAIELVPQFGWCEELLENASIMLGFNENYAQLLFINGISELIDIYFDHIDNLMFEQLEKLDTPNGISAKIKLALKTRINILANFRQTTARTISFLSLPWNAALGFRLGFRSMDRIWSDYVGDGSTDFNYYTKRTLLYAVYVASVQFFLNDNSINLSETEDFINRRIDNVLNFGRFIANFKMF